MMFRPMFERAMFPVGQRTNAALQPLNQFRVAREEILVSRFDDAGAVQPVTNLQRRRFFKVSAELKLQKLRKQCLVQKILRASLVGDERTLFGIQDCW